MHGIALHCMALHCIVLRSVVPGTLNSTMQSIQRSPSWYRMALHCMAFHCIAWRCIDCMALHCVVLRPVVPGTLNSTMQSTMTSHFYFILFLSFVFRCLEQFSDWSIQRLTGNLTINNDKSFFPPFFWVVCFSVLGAVFGLVNSTFHWPLH